MPIDRLQNKDVSKAPMTYAEATAATAFAVQFTDTILPGKWVIDSHLDIYFEVNKSVPGTVKTTPDYDILRGSFLQFKALAFASEGPQLSLYEIAKLNLPLEGERTTYRVTNAAGQDIIRCQVDLDSASMNKLQAEIQAAMKMANVNSAVMELSLNIDTTQIYSVQPTITSKKVIVAPHYFSVNLSALLPQQIATIRGTDFERISQANIVVGDKQEFDVVRQMVRRPDAMLEYVALLFPTGTDVNTLFGILPNAGYINLVGYNLDGKPEVIREFTGQNLVNDSYNSHGDLELNALMIKMVDDGGNGVPIAKYSKVVLQIDYKAVPTPNNFVTLCKANFAA